MVHKFLIVLRPSLLSTEFSSTTTALSRDPPLANPIFFIFQYLRINKKFLKYIYFLNSSIWKLTEFFVYQLSCFQSLVYNLLQKSYLV